jgi:hypothetical protein
MIAEDLRLNLLVYWVRAPRAAVLRSESEEEVLFSVGLVGMHVLDRACHLFVI